MMSTQAADLKILVSPATDLRSILTRKAEVILEGYPDVGRLEIDNLRSRTALVLPRRNEDGFDVEVEAYPEELMLLTHGVHVHFDDHYDSELYDTEELVEQALGMTRDLLSPDMRIRELRAGNKPYR